MANAAYHFRTTVYIERRNDSPIQARKSYSLGREAFGKSQKIFYVVYQIIRAPVYRHWQVRTQYYRLVLKRKI